MKGKRIKVTFVLPGRGTKPIGGFRIVYEYANRLSDQGFDISIAHVAWLYKTNSFLSGLGRYVYCLLFYPFYKKWLPLRKEVNNKWIFTIRPFLIPDADYIVATSWETAEYIADLPLIKGEKLYIVQADESEFSYVTKNGWANRVTGTWLLPLQKIAICTWLKERIEAIGSTASVIFNGLNFDDFFIEIPPEKRGDNTIMMLYHPSPHKGCAEGLQALRIIKESVEDLRVVLFGFPAKPSNLENWMEYHQLPSRETLRRLYNESAIFLSPSHSEGWGLPVSEAMQCGCAAVTSDIGGFKDFMMDGETGICFKVGEVQDMVEKINSLLLNRENRITLALRGNTYIQRFSWDRAVNDLTGLLRKKKVA